MIFKKNLLLSSLFLSILGYSQSAFAVTLVNPMGTGTSASTTFSQMIDRVLSWIFPVSLIIAVLMIIIGGYYWLFSAGDPKKIASGRKIIFSALIGVVVVTMAKGVVNLLRTVFPANMPPEQLLPTIITWVFGFLLASGVLVLIIVGYTLVTAGGDPERLQKGKKWAIYALAGMAIAVLARGIVALVLKIVWG